MSGGAWNYQQFKIREEADRLNNTLLLVAQTEKELDWGVSGDTCIECAYRRVGRAWEIFFESSRETLDIALSVIQDRDQYYCSRCKERFQK